MKEKLLTIAIPTYNRSDSLTRLSVEFIGPLLDRLGNKIAVLVCDNSVQQVAEVNRTAIDARVEYHWNKQNIGFAGNVRECLLRTKTRYVWLISDDDPVILMNFIAAFEQLESDTDLGCLMLPYLTHGHMGDPIVCNSEASWKAGELTLSGLLKTGQLPFTFISSAFIRIRKDQVDKYAREASENAYAHSIYFIYMLEADFPIKFAALPVVIYNCDHAHGAISILSMRRSLCCLRELLDRDFALFKRSEMRDYQGWLLWMIHHRGGLYNLKDADKERMELLMESKNYISFKTVALVAVILLPVWLLRPLYLLYRARLDRAPNRGFGVSFRRNLEFTRQIYHARS